MFVKDSDISYIPSIRFPLVWSILYRISEKDSSRLEIRPAVLDDLYQFGNIMDNTSGGCSKLAEVGGAWNCQLYDGVKDVSII